ncbi:Thymidylate kinase, partial [Bienertia sinuspersici]
CGREEQVWSRSIQPHDIWLIKGGFKFEVRFNRFYQPIRKGGAVLVKFVADVAKKSDSCHIDEAEHGREPGGYELFDKTHQTKDKVYPDNTITQEFIAFNVVKSKIDANIASSSSKPQIKIENEIFNELMYDNDKSYQKPIGYGFGVSHDVIGVYDLLRKRGITSEMSNNEDNDL